MAPELQRRQCANHPDRHGHALCMTCGKTVCQECATEWDGINYCVACLSGQRKATRLSSPALGWILLVAACAGLFFIARWAMVWGTSFFFRTSF